MSTHASASSGRAWARWAAAAVLLSALGEALLWSGGLPAPVVLPRFRWGVALVALAALLFAVALRGRPVIDAMAPARPGSDERPFALGLAPALGVSFLNALLVIASGETRATRWLWLLSVLLLFWPVPSEWRRPRRPAWTATVAVGAVVLVAFALRASERATLPLALHGDMAEMGLGGRAILHGVDRFVAVGWASIPWTGFLPAALGLAISDDLSGLRLASALLGTAAVAGVYVLGAFLFGRRVGIAAAGIAAVGYSEIHFSRLPAYGDPVPFLVFALYALLRGLRTGERFAFVAAGALGGAACLLYYSGRVAPVLMAAVLLHAAVVWPAVLRARWRGLATAVASALVTVGPMALYYLDQPHELTARQHDVSVFTPHVARHLENAYGVSSVGEVVRRQMARAALAFHHTPDTSLQFGFPRPMISPFFAPFAGLGLAACLVGWRATGRFLLVAWWALVVLGAAVFTADAPFWPRLVVVLPAAALLVAIGLDHTFDVLAALGLGIGSPRGRLAASAVLVCAVGAVNWSWYTARERVHVDAADWLARLVVAEADARFCMVPGPLSFREEEVRFLAPGRDLREVDVAAVASCAAEGRVLVVYPEQPDVLAAARALAPGAREVPHPYPNGAPGPVFVHVGSADR